MTVTVGVELLLLPLDEQGDWSAELPPLPVPVPLPPGQVATLPTVCDPAAHGGGAVGQHDRHRVARLDQVLLGHLQSRR